MTPRTRKATYRIRRANRRFYRWACAQKPNARFTEEDILQRADRWGDIIDDLMNKYFPGQDNIDTLSKIMRRQIR
jgi:hypothetical protein